MHYVELFCGCGGLAEGLRQAGWECDLAVDWDDYALGVYRANFRTHRTLRHDLRTPLPVDALSEAVRHRLRTGGALVGGSPCQDFALTCAPEKRGERAQLTSGFARHVEALRPRWILFENVKTAAHRPAFLELVADLEALGYATEHRILKLRDLGVSPQPRKRLFLIAHATSGEAVRRAWAHIEAAFGAQRTVPTMRETFAAFGAPTYGRNHVYYPVPRALAIQPSIFPLDHRAERPVLFTVRGRTRRMPSTYVFVDKDSSQDRDDIFAIETAHLLALQGFPPSFRVEGPGGKRDTAVGNAVPPPMAAILGRALAEADFLSPSGSL